MLLFGIGEGIDDDDDGDVENFYKESDEDDSHLISAF